MEMQKKSMLLVVYCSLLIQAKSTWEKSTTNGDTTPKPTVTVSTQKMVTIYMSCSYCYGKAKIDPKCTSGCNKFITWPADKALIKSATQRPSTVNRFRRVNDSNNAFMALSEEEEKKVDTLLPKFVLHSESSVVALLAGILACLVLLLVVIAVGLCCYATKKKRSVKKEPPKSTVLTLRPLEFQNV
ncbi:uncharacterized protein LOC130613217 [Hydractinia symbiolongicarpus]|uniref:uncharacterized protein LOC130613217 n=1 Tax=Hydractinia symbiolongicarpus TaxID=13093 RepID=UPI0025518F1A|nr:uncharacterized protein LOC130613217 [Hydractinia symbiolongicarpus]